MANIQDIRNNEEFKNYVSCQVALSKTGEVLQPYTEDVLRRLHVNIQNTLQPQALPVCPNLCSQFYGGGQNAVNRWCLTCQKWRAELEQKLLPNSGQGAWHKMESWEWPNHYNKIAQVYIQPGWDVTNIRFQDISTIFSIWKRCLAFPRPIVNLSDPLKQQRNVVAHANILVTKAARKLHFQEIRKVISDPAIQATIPNYQDVLQMMNDLEQGQLHNYSDDINKLLQDIGNCHNGLKDQLEDFKQVVLDRHGELVSMNRYTHKLILLAIFLCILAIFVPYVPSYMPPLLSWYHGEGTPARRALPAHQPEHGGMQRVDPVIYCDNVTIVTRENWGARPPKQVDRMETPVSFVFIHHAASGECFTEKRCAREARMLQNYHMDGPGWDDIGYNFMVGEDGNVYECRAWDRIGAHTKGWNNVSISICFMGDYSDKLPTSEALMAAKALIECGVDLGKVTSDYKLCGHRDVRGTEGPGEMLYREIQTWDHYGCYKPDKPSHIPH